MVVIDIDEFKTSYNYNKPSLDTDAEAVKAENVRDIYAVVVENGNFSLYFMLIDLLYFRTIYSVKPRH